MYTVCIRQMAIDCFWFNTIAQSIPKIARYVMIYNRSSNISYANFTAHAHLFVRSSTTATKKTAKNQFTYTLYAECICLDFFVVYDRFVQKSNRWSSQ